MTKWTIKKEHSDPRLDEDFPYGKHEGRNIYLLTPKEFKELPDGSVVVDIFGFEYTKGIDKIDDDIRFGHLAYGLLNNE